MLSLSASNTLDPAHQRDFVPYQPQAVADLLKVITEKVWSPLLWKGGIRTKANFLQTSYAVLDFDSGRPSLSEIKAELESLGVKYILGTTKSHQKAKTTPSGKLSAPCDRYRLVLKAESVITNRELYEYNMGLLASYWGCDKSCTDAARFFFPCTSVYAVKTTGGVVPWIPFDEDYIPEAERYARRRQQLEAAGRSGLAPKWVQDILTGATTVTPGDRHKTCYRLGATLAAMGMGEEKILAAVMRTKLSEIGPDDVYRAVTNGIRAELGGYP